MKPVTAKARARREKRMERMRDADTREQAVKAMEAYESSLWGALWMGPPLAVWLGGWAGQFLDRVDITNAGIVADLAAWLGMAVFGGLVWLFCLVGITDRYFQPRALAKHLAEVDERYGWRPRAGVEHPPGRTDFYDRYLLERENVDGNVYVALAQWTYRARGEKQQECWNRAAYLGLPSKEGEQPQKVTMNPHARPEARAAVWRRMVEEGGAACFDPEDSEAREEHEQRLTQLASQMGGGAMEAHNQKKLEAEIREAREKLAAGVVERAGRREVVV